MRVKVPAPTATQAIRPSQLPLLRPFSAPEDTERAKRPNSAAQLGDATRLGHSFGAVDVHHKVPLVGNSPRVIAQRNQIESAFGMPVQRQGAKGHEDSFKSSPLDVLAYQPQSNKEPGNQSDVVQRAQVKGEGGEWEDTTIDFATLTAEQIANIRSNLHGLWNAEGTYKLTKAEVRALNKRSSELYNSPEAVEARARKAEEDDKAALKKLEDSLAGGEEWVLSGSPSQMGVSDRGFTQNWEIAIAVGGLRGVLHLHFNTNDRTEVSGETLGKAHIKTYLESNAGNIPAPESMVTEGIAKI